MAISEAVYEKLDPRLTTAGTSRGRQRGRVLYEDVEEDDRTPISVEYYDDVTADDNETNVDDILIGEKKTDKQPESSDDVDGVNIVEKSCDVTDYVLENTGYDDVGDSVEGLLSESVREEGLEYYDDVITDEINPKMTKAMEETNAANEEEVEYYDDITNEVNDLKITAGMMVADQLQENDSVVTGIDYDDVGVESEE